MVGIVLALAIFVAFGLFLRWLGSRKNPIFAVIVPANTTAIVLSKPNTLQKDKDGAFIGVNNDGGSIIDLIHAVPGRRLNKSDQDPMGLYLEKDTESRSLLYHLFGVIIIGPLRYLRTNDVRTHRWGRKDKDEKYSLMPKTQHTAYPFFSGQHDVRLEGVETKAIIAFNLRLNFSIEEMYPVRARLRFADAYAQLVVIISAYVVDKIGEVDPKDFITADEKNRKKKTEDLKNKLEEDLSAGSAVAHSVLEETGLFIRKASLPEIDFDEKTKELLEAAAKAELEGNAEVIQAANQAEANLKLAAADKKKGIWQNDVRADLLERVLAKAGESPEVAKNFRADVGASAYRGNDKVTVFAPGSDKMLQVPLPLPEGEK